MYTNILPTTEKLREYVKVNAGLNESVWFPFRADAFRMLKTYVPETFLADLNTFSEPAELDILDTKYQALLLLERPIACFIMAIGNPEMSIGVGDAGHTVTRTDKLAPANDTKVKAYQDNLFQRGWNSVEDLLVYIENNAAELNISLPTKTTLFASAKDLQDNGNININYSRLTFETLKQGLKSIEKNVLKKLITTKVFEKLLAPSTDLDTDLLALAKQFVAAKTASLIASTKNAERYNYSPVILTPIFAETQELSWYGLQAEMLRSEIIDLVNDNIKYFNLPSKIGVQDINYNQEESSVFFMG